MLDVDGILGVQSERAVQFSTKNTNAQLIKLTSICLQNIFPVRLTLLSITCFNIKTNIILFEASPSIAPSQG